MYVEELVNSTCLYGPGHTLCAVLWKNVLSSPPSSYYVCLFDIWFVFINVHWLQTCISEFVPSQPCPNSCKTVSDDLYELQHYMLVSYTCTLIILLGWSLGQHQHRLLLSCLPGLSRVWGVSSLKLHSSGQCSTNIYRLGSLLQENFWNSCGVKEPQKCLP